jgi:hypothetical protein
MVASLSRGLQSIANQSLIDPDLYISEYPLAVVAEASRTHRLV